MLPFIIGGIVGATITAVIAYNEEENEKKSVAVQELLREQEDFMKKMEAKEHEMQELIDGMHAKVRRLEDGLTQ